MKRMKDKENNFALSQSVRVGLTCFLAYCACYIGKNILSAIMPQMLDENVLDNTTLGVLFSLLSCRFKLAPKQDPDPPEAPTE